MPIEKMLFPTKFRELAFNSLESLLVLKKAGLKEIILLHVIPRDEVGFVPYGGYLKEEEEKRREEARIRFEDWQKTLSDKGVRSRILIVVGETIPQILTIAEKEKIDMVVLGRKKRTGIEKSFIGSHTYPILSRIKVPTLLSKYFIEYKMDGTAFSRKNDRVFNFPLLATNWQEPSQKALEFLISLKGVVKKVFVFHNIDVKVSGGHVKEDLRCAEKECAEKIYDYCERLKSEGIMAESHIGAGDTVEELLRISREREASMIIMGTTCKDRLHEILSKSVSHRVAKQSELPTLLVPSEICMR